MISFVWSSKYPFLGGTGGSENYTVGQIRELQRRGISTRIITIGHGDHDGRDAFPDIPFTALAHKDALATLDDTLVFVTYPLDVPTKRTSYAILHCPPVSCGRVDPLFDFKGAAGKKMLTPSTFAASLWSKHLRQDASQIATVYPFAEDPYRKVRRAAKKAGEKVKILFAGRLTPDKGIYTLLAALHMDKLLDLPFELSATDACSHTPEGQIIRRLLAEHPLVNLIPARNTPGEMAELMAEQDIVVMPSTNIFWQEMFGIVSVEAQHAGCRVVASNAGGLPETDCGSLLLVEPDNPEALANGIAQAAALGPVDAVKRQLAAAKFTVKASVDRLLEIIGEADEVALKLPKTALRHTPAIQLPRPLPRHERYQTA